MNQRVKLFEIALIATAAMLASGCAPTLGQAPAVVGARAEPLGVVRHDQALPAEGAAGPTTGRVLSRNDILASAPLAVLGDAVYAEVNSNWLPSFHDYFCTTLYGDGILEWDARSAGHFASYYVALAQARFYRETFYNFEKANAMAIGTVSYASTDGSGHALVVALTERGRIFIEPQSGNEVELTPAEQVGTFLEVF